MKTLIPLVFVVGLVTLASGQQLITDDSVVLKKGIYKDFYEFKYNKPSLSFDYPVIVTSFSDHIHILMVDKKTARSLKEIYGFCDGKDVYLLFGEKLKRNTCFLKVSVLGRYCLLWYTSFDMIPIHVRGLSFVLPVGKSDKIKIIDMNTGKPAVEPLKSIIEDDPEIYSRYLSDRHYLLNQLIYLAEYSLKHKGEIERDPGDMTSGEINAILMPQPGDTNLNTYYDKIRGELSICRNIMEIKISASKYSNGNYKFIGLRALHKYGHDPDYWYRIGLWRYYHRNGQIKREVIYDITGDDYQAYKHLVIF